MGVKSAVLGETAAFTVSAKPARFGDNSEPGVDLFGITGQDDVVADFFQVLASPIRLAIVRMLIDGERYVGHLMAELRIAQPRLSNHLACLRNCGFVTARREGTFVYYRLAEPRVADIVQLAGALASSRESALTRCGVIQGETQHHPT